MDKQWRKYAKRGAQWAVVVATIAVLVNAGMQRSSGIGDLSLKFDPFGLVSAALATTAANLFLPLGWKQLVASFGHHLAPGQAVRLWCLAQTARYFPTGLLAVASRLQLAARAGISRSITASSMAIETAALFGWAFLVCAIFVPSDSLSLSLRWLVGISCAFGLIASPWLISFIGLRLSRIKKLSVTAPHSLKAAEGVGLLGLSVAARAIGTTCLAVGLLGIGSDDVALIVGATYAGIAVGMVGITPAGLGVREGVTAAILASRFGLTDAAAFALVSRAWEFGFEMAFLVVASWWGRNRPSKNDLNGDSLIPEAKL